VLNLISGLISNIQPTGLSGWLNIKYIPYDKNLKSAVVFFGFIFLKIFFSLSSQVINSADLHTKVEL
jgi:hypothetical protein